MDLIKYLFSTENYKWWWFWNPQTGVTGGLLFLLFSVGLCYLNRDLYFVCVAAFVASVSIGWIAIEKDW